jgi:hypothetical protein
MKTFVRQNRVLSICANAASILFTIQCCLFWLSDEASAQGSLTPPGPPAPTMVTLQQIEPRRPISSVPFTISASGSYYLTANLTVSVGDAIDINASGVTLDLNGFAISSTQEALAPTGNGIFALPNTSKGILIGGGQQNIHILNGSIAGNVAYSAGSYSGPGFAYGIYCSAVSGVPSSYNVCVTGVSVFGCLDDGINLGSGNSSIVESCTVNTVGGNGIVADIVAKSVALTCGGDGIDATTANNCIGGAVASGQGLYAVGTVEGCSGSSDVGTGLSANMAGNCYGSSNTGTGLNAAYNAANCLGSSQSGTGLNSGNIAANCFGSSQTGTGLSATTAENCEGSSTPIYNPNNPNPYSGTGLSAQTAENCVGSSAYGTGLAAAINASNCYGFCNEGPGLSANSAANCYGISETSVGLSATYANFCFGQGRPGVSVSGNSYNMPP